MATRRQTTKNGLEEAMRQLVQAQAALTQNQASFLARISEMDRVNSERFAKIEEDLTIIKTMLIRHEQMLRELPAAIRDKIGFKTAK